MALLLGSSSALPLSLRSGDVDVKSDSILDGITHCAFTWLEQLPPNLVEQNKAVLNKLGGGLPENLVVCRQITGQFMISFLLDLRSIEYDGPPNTRK